MSSPKSSAVNEIDIASILMSKISVNIDIGKSDIDPALQRTNAARASWSRTCRDQLCDLS